MRKFRTAQAFILVLSMLLSAAPVYAKSSLPSADKDVKVSIAKDYVSARFTITFQNKGNYDVSVYDEDNNIHNATFSDDKTAECVIQDVKAGEWNVLINKNDASASSSDSETSEADDIGKVSVKVEGYDEEVVDVSKDIVVATDIAGLKMYFRDDTFVAEWTDTTCGSVDVKVTDSKTMEILDQQTVDTTSYEYLVDPSKNKEITVTVVPSVSSEVEGSQQTFTFNTYNHPDAVVSFGDTSVTNKDTVHADVKMKKSYKLLAMVNNEKVKETEMLPVGENSIDIPIEVGTNNIVLYVVDDKGNMRSTSTIIEKDVVAPVLQLKQSYEGIQTKNENYTFDGSLQDYDKFTANGKDVKINGDNTFSYTYELKEGLNTIAFIATDKAGNESEYDATVTRIIPKSVPIPWLRISIGTILSLIVGIYIYDVLKGKQKRETKDSGKTKRQKEVKDKTHNNKRIEKKVEDESWYIALLRDLVSVLTPIIIVLIFCRCIILVTDVESGSMQPKLMVGNTAVYSRISYETKAVKRGDIIIFWSDEFNEYLAKRVIGLPGDTISFKDGYVVIDGKYLDESDYIGENVETNSLDTFKVPDNCVFVLGDNREDSYDSRFFKKPYIPADKIAGKYIGQFGFSFKYDIIVPLEKKFGIKL